MKVLHLLDSLNRGGAETLVLDICRNSVKKEFEVSLVTTGEGELLNDFIETGINVYKFKRRFFIDLFLIKKIKAIIKTEDIQILHAHQAVDGLHAYLAAKGTKAKLVLSFHGYFQNFKNDLVLNFLIKKVDANITVSNSFLERLKHKSKLSVKNNFHVIYNGIDSTKLRVNVCTLKKELGFDENTIVLGMVGNFINNGRDQLTVCKALSSLNRELFDFRFVFVGKRLEKNPFYFDQCVMYCKKHNLTDKVHFLGQRSDIANILNSIDGFVYASKSDSFGIAVVEAMMAKIPVIINDLPPLLEITGNGKYAIVFKSKDANDLKLKIESLIKSKLSNKCDLDGAMKWALNNFSINSHINSLKKIYQQILLS